jgi:surface antigen
MKGSCDLSAMRFAIRTALLGTMLLVVPLLGACTTAMGNRSLAELSAPLATGPLAGEFGASLDTRARALAARTEYRALEGGLAGAPVNWKVSEKLYGSVTPQQAFSVGATNCRRYTHVIVENGASRAAAATACRDEAGIWRPLS